MHSLLKFKLKFSWGGIKDFDLAVKYISEGNPYLKLTPSDLKRLFSLATAEIHFLFKGSFYDQIDGVAMGSPLAPVLANLFMGHHEKIWLEQYQGPEVLFYRRYVDDTFCLFHSEQDAIAFFDYINSQHPNIRFMMEKEIDHVLPFLDVLIDNTHHGSIAHQLPQFRTSVIQNRSYQDIN